MEVCGRAPGCLCNVLAVLGDGEESLWQTFWSAVELADDRRARLTLAKTCDAGRSYVWVAPFAAGGAYIPPEVASPEEAARLLGHVAQHVPDSIPVTTMVLGADTPASLLRLLRTGNYGAIVADRDLLVRCWRVRRQLRRDGLLTVVIADGRAEQLTQERHGLRRLLDKAHDAQRRRQHHGVGGEQPV